MRKMHVLLAAVLATSTLGCDKIPFLGGGENPAVVARAFWAAMAEGDIDAASQYAIVTESDVTTSLSADADMALTNLVVADATEDGDVATSQTTMHIQNQQINADLDFVTTMLKIDSEWKVDQNTTLSAMADVAMRQILGASASEVVGELANAMGEAMAPLVEGMGQAMQGAAEAMAEGMGEAMNSLNRQMASTAREIPWNPEFTGTIDPGMTRDQVISIWGEPVTERVNGNFGYMFYRNGCEIACGMYDTVLLEGNQVIDAVVRGAGHRYSGISSSPPGRTPEETLPQSAVQ